jgi:hypothetical protein
MGNRLDAKDTFAFAIDLQGQLAAVQLEDRQIIGQVSRRSLPTRPIAWFGDISVGDGIPGSS